MELEVTRAVLERLRAEAAAAHPRECCGVLHGRGRRIDAIRPAANVHPSPETRFAIDPQALVDAFRAERAGGPQVLGYYHSHPSGPPEPSATDRAMAAHDGRAWVIVAGEEIRLWRDHEHGFEPLSYVVVAD